MPACMYTCQIGHVGSTFIASESTRLSLLSASDVLEVLAGLATFDTWQQRLPGSSAQGSAAATAAASHKPVCLGCLNCDSACSNHVCAAACHRDCCRVGSKYLWRYLMLSGPCLAICCKLALNKPLNTSVLAGLWCHACTPSVVVACSASVTVEQHSRSSVMVAASELLQAAVTDCAIPKIAAASNSFVKFLFQLISWLCCTCRSQ